jgi:tetratricopeptide (TPR) repeat protein
LAGVPGWPARIEALSRRLSPADEPARRQVLELAANGRTGAALATLIDRLGAEVASRELADLTAGDHPLPPVLVALAAAPWRAVITTGFDGSWIRAHHEARTDPLLLTAGRPVDDEAAALDEEVRLLLYVLGRADHPDTLCLGPADLRHQVVDTGLGDVLADLARRCSFVFVGFEPGDPDLEWVAGRLIGSAGGSHPHFVLCPGANRLEVAMLGTAAGLEPIETSAPPEEALAALAEVASVPGRRRRRKRSGAARSRRIQAATRWQRAAATLERLADLDRDPDAQAMYLYAAALIHRDRMGDRSAATGLLDRALELDPALGPAWEALAHLVGDGPGFETKPAEPALPLTRELSDDEQMLWATRMFSGARRGQA